MGCELSKVATVKPPPQTAADPLTAKQKYTVMASWKAVSRALEPTGVYMLIRLFEQLPRGNLIKLDLPIPDIGVRDERVDQRRLVHLEPPESINGPYTCITPGILVNLLIVGRNFFLHCNPLLHRLFEENEELLNMFTQFRELKTKEQQSKSMELAQHAQKVMTALDEGIKGLDDMDVFLTCLHQVGAKHTKIPGFDPQYFWKIEKPFLEAVERTLEDRYSENVQNSYKVTIKFIIETLIDGFDKAQNDKTQSDADKS